jgi:hypothetical protein
MCTFGLEMEAGRLKNFAVPSPDAVLANDRNTYIKRELIGF